MSIDSSIVNAGTEREIGDIVKVKSYQTNNITGSFKYSFCTNFYKSTQTSC